MPGGDGTGPWGTWTNCTPVDEYGNSMPRRRFWRRGGFGMGGGMGFGRGWRWRAMPIEPVPLQPVAQPQMTKEQEKSELENEAKLMEQEQQELKAELADIKKRIEKLKKKK